MISRRPLGKRQRELLSNPYKGMVVAGGGTSLPLSVGESLVKRGILTYGWDRAYYTMQYGKQRTTIRRYYQIIDWRAVFYHLGYDETVFGDYLSVTVRHNMFLAFIGQTQTLYICPECLGEFHIEDYQRDNDDTLTFSCICECGFKAHIRWLANER